MLKTKIQILHHAVKNYLKSDNETLRNLALSAQLSMHQYEKCMVGLKSVADTQLEGLRRIPDDIDFPNPYETYVINHYIASLAQLDIIACHLAVEYKKLGIPFKL